MFIYKYTCMHLISDFYYSLGISDVLGHALGISSLVCASTLTVVAATLFPSFIGSASKSGGVLGVLIMQFFFAVTGAMGHMGNVARFGPSIFVHTTIQIFVHFVVIVSLGKLFKLPCKEIALGEYDFH